MVRVTTDKNEIAFLEKSVFLQWPFYGNYDLAVTLDSNAFFLGTYRWLHCAACDIRAIGIGKVYVAEDCRGKGNASKLLRESLPMLSNRGVLAAVLYSKNRSLYYRAGFRFAGNDLWVRSLTPAFTFRISDNWSLVPGDHF